MIETNSLTLKKGSFFNELFETIDVPQFQNRHKIGIKSFTRERKLTFKLVFSTILKFVTRSLSIECELLEANENKLPPSKQAFSKARYKLSHECFEELLRDSTKFYYMRRCPKTWRGYRIIGVDGSSIRLPNSEEVAAKFGKFKCNNTDGKQPILGRVSLCVDLCGSMILSGRLANWGIGEGKLAEEQLSEVTKLLRGFGEEKMVYVYDRGYTSFNFIKQHIELGVDFLFRL